MKGYQLLFMFHFLKVLKFNILVKKKTFIQYKLLIFIFLDNIRNYSVLSVVVEETLVFSTKKRAPFCLCLELFGPEEPQEY